MMLWFLLCEHRAKIQNCSRNLHCCAVLFVSKGYAELTKYFSERFLSLH